jgi:hypothetical protein
VFSTLLITWTNRNLKPKSSFFTYTIFIFCCDCVTRQSMRVTEINTSSNNVVTDNDSTIIRKLGNDEEITVETDELTTASSSNLLLQDKTAPWFTIEAGSIHDQDSDCSFSAITLNESLDTSSVIRPWNNRTLFSDFVQDGLRSSRGDERICMVFENPSCSPQEATFFNGNTFKFHEFPPSPPLYKAVLTPCRYSMMNGNVYPSYLQGGIPPLGLVEHWKATIPGFVEPVFVPEIPTEGKVYAYLPMESVTNYVNDPHVHYHLCGKDALHLSKYRTLTCLSDADFLLII